MDYFIGSLRDEVRILKELPPEQKAKIERDSLYSMPPISWSNMTYYYNVVSNNFLKDTFLRQGRSFYGVFKAPMTVHITFNCPDLKFVSITFKYASYCIPLNLRKQA